MNSEYAIKNGVLTHISDVERGLKCNCVCPGCGEIMIARKGEKVAHHFAHQSAECAHGLETTLHLMAKAILEQEKKIVLPKVEIPLGYNNIISEAKMIEFDEVILEKRLDEMVPDVFVKIGDKVLLIEIWVTHKIDDSKRKKIEDSDISTLEINLSSFDKMINMEELRRIFLEETECKRWAYNHLAMDYKQKWLSVCETKRTIRRGFALHVDKCPINVRVWRGKSYANVIDDCSGCKYFMGSFIIKNGKHDYTDDQFIYCSGKMKISTFFELKHHIRKAVTGV